MVTEVDIPRSAWENWIETGKARKLRRPLTEEERKALVARRDELAPFIAGFEGNEEKSRVGLALAEMLGSFRSMRQTGVDVAGQVEGAMSVLAKYPAWAIEKACHSIHERGVFRKGEYDRQWPPSDAEIILEVKEKLRLYGDQYENAVALLTAEVAA